MLSRLRLLALLLCLLPFMGTVGRALHGFDHQAQGEGGHHAHSSDEHAPGEDCRLCLAQAFDEQPRVAPALGEERLLGSLLPVPSETPRQRAPAAFSPRGPPQSAVGLS